MPVEVELELELWGEVWVADEVWVWEEVWVVVVEDSGDEVWVAAEAGGEAEAGGADVHNLGKMKF